MKELEELESDYARRTTLLIEVSFTIRAFLDMVKRKRRQRAEPWHDLVEQYFEDIKVKIEQELKL